MQDVRNFKRIYSTSEAKKMFFNRTKIYFYCRAKLEEDNTYEYYLFDVALSFEDNFNKYLKRFKNIGYWSLYTDFNKYPFDVSLPVKSNTQLQFSY